MAKYLFRRLLHGLFSVVCVVMIVMVLIYSLMNRELVFANDGNWNKKVDNQKVTYELTKYEAYGYLDYVPYADYLKEQEKLGNISKADSTKASSLGNTPDKDSELTKEWTKKFKEFYESKGYTVERLDYVSKTKQKSVLYAKKDIPVLQRAWKYFTNLIQIDNIHYVEKTTGEKLENTGIKFTLFDPVYNNNLKYVTDENGTHVEEIEVKKKLSPAIIGTGTKHKYLLYFDSQFPYIHQKLISVNLGLSYVVNKDVDIWTTMFTKQDPKIIKTIHYETGFEEKGSKDIHTAAYVAGSRESLAINKTRFVDDYTDCLFYQKNFSKTGFSFFIGLISVIITYLLGVPLGIMMARHKDGIADKIGTIYIVFIIAVPSLAYIFMFKAIGGAMKLPTSFDLTKDNKLMYVLPIISLSLPSIASIMKWLRRYMIDQMNSDYVRFARSGGLSENEIFSRHILKNAIIPIVHGIPGAILGSIVGAIITESVYRVPGSGRLLTDAINKYDNGVIVGLTLFYAVLSIVSLILGDIMMSIVDPRISYNDKNR